MIDDVVNDCKRICTATPSIKSVIVVLISRNNFFFCRWPMKKIMIAIAALWKNTSEQDRQPFLEKAKIDSDRYKDQMKSFVQTEEYQKSRKLQKRHRRIKQDIKGSTSKELLLQGAFDLFAKDHGGTKEEIKSLWEDTSDVIKDEYIEKSKSIQTSSKKVVISTRSRREIKVPSRLLDSSSIKTSTPYDNFVQAHRNLHPGMSKNQLTKLLKDDWQGLSAEEKRFYETSAGIDYKALDDASYMDEELDSDD